MSLTNTRLFSNARCGRISRKPKRCLFYQKNDDGYSVRFIYSPRIYSHLNFLVATAASGMRRKASTWRGKENNQDNCDPSSNAVAVAMVTNSPDQSGTAFQMFAFIHSRERYGYPWLRTFRALTRWNSHFRKLHPSQRVLTKIN